MSEKDLPIFPRSSLKRRVGALEMLQREFCTEGPDETGVPEKAKCRLGGWCHPGSDLRVQQESQLVSLLLREQKGLV